MADPTSVRAAVLADLAAESDALDALVADLPEADWQRPTPAAGWTIADQIGHLTWTDEVSTIAATDTSAFEVLLTEALAEFANSYVDRAASERAAHPPTRVLQRWRAGRQTLANALTAVDPSVKLPWFGPPMGPASMATARLMETWAHGQDIADALGIDRTPTDRLRHVAHIGARTRDFAYALRDLTPPGDPFRIELAAPGGDTWTWGPDDADQRVTGPALDFCLLVTQRRHRDDVAVQAVGADADAWLSIAQAFAGPPGPGRERRTAEPGT